MSFNLTTEDYPRYTYKDYEMWEGDWELIRGIPYAMSPAPIGNTRNLAAGSLLYFPLH